MNVLHSSIVLLAVMLAQLSPINRGVTQAEIFHEDHDENLVTPDEGVASHASALDTASTNALHVGVTLTRRDHEYEDFPQGMTSFGAALLGGKIYVTGGKSGRAHRYARSYQNGKIFCLDLEGKEWETVGETLGLQGLALVAHDGRLIRIGGLEARNEEGEEHQLRSIAAVKAFDVKTKMWTTMPELPQSRSSFDACVHDNKVFVVGGWKLAMDEEPVWADDMLVLDLSSEELKWQEIDAPFATRALAVRAFDNKIFAVGGITEGGGTTESVHVYDIKKGEWHEGPNVPCDDNIKAFGCSAVSVAEHFFVSTYDGAIYQLSDDQKAWKKLHQMDEGRFFHQMIPTGDSSFAIIGGSHMEHGSQVEIAVFDVSETTETNASSSGR